MFPLKAPRDCPPGITHLSLQNNLLPDLAGEDLRGLTCVRALNLSSNGLTTLPEQISLSHCVLLCLLLCPVRCLNMLLRILMTRSTCVCVAVHVSLYLRALETLDVRYNHITNMAVSIGGMFLKPVPLTLLASHNPLTGQ